MPKILIIGFGSIGQRHFEILKKFKSSIKIISNRNLKNINQINFSKKEILHFNPDYVIISSKTSLHLKHFIKINSFISNKVILIEKPIFHICPKETINLKNFVFVGFNMRFNPLIMYLKKFFENYKYRIYSLNVYCGSFLPSWRNNVDYSKSSSALKVGGGVINDLMHEFDYINWIFGKIVINNKVKRRLSNLNIKSSDFANFTGVCGKKINFNIMLNYFSFINHRYIIIDTEIETLHVDLISHSISIKKINYKKIKSRKWKFTRNYSYIKMHNAIFSKNYKNLCTFNEAMNYLNIS